MNMTMSPSPSSALLCTPLPMFSHWPPAQVSSRGAVVVVVLLLLVLLQRGGGGHMTGLGRASVEGETNLSLNIYT